MPIKVIYEYPNEHRLRRILSALMRFIGACLLAAGLTGAAPVLFFLIIVIWSLIKGESTGFDGQGYIDYAILSTFVLLFLLLGRWLLRGRRRPVLFLRRFGFVGATEALTFALTNAIGSSWRLITLDDHAVSPLGTSSRLRWTTLAGITLSVLLPAALFLWFWFIGFDQIAKSNDSHAQGLGQVLGNLLVTFVLLVVVFLVIIFFALLFLILGVFSLGSYIAVRRAERSKRIAVTTAAQLEPVSRSVARRVRRVISPKLVVVRVADSVWQDAVRRLATISAAIVIDVSEPTRNLLWEVSTLRSELRLHWVLVAEEGRLQQWTAAVESELNQKLLSLLDGESVLAYSGERAERKRFARALRNRLEALSRSDI